ncbi:Lsr2 family protein [Actinomadura syzygii]|uniref:Lsr2 family protein n=1 Tax=Actinomadura syzygii TaxID=1427538 RepID=A0A5D0TTC3_9ACTN|nr:Lsr2 family protein [Actinomadura syzygii]TYC08582.1 Lsr2 family protein [Actinomadura syzygii]
MATRSIVESDLSGKGDAATITFGLGGTWYEIDLTPEEEEKLASTLKTYIEAGRKAAADNKPEKVRQVPETTVEERDEIRAWAKKEGIELAERGRIPKKVMAAYDAAHPERRGKK